MASEARRVRRDSSGRSGSRAPGMWPATRSIGSTSPRYRSGARASTRRQSARRRGVADIGDRCQHLRPRLRRESAAAPDLDSAGFVGRLRRPTLRSRRSVPPPRRAPAIAASTTAGSRTARSPGRTRRPGWPRRCRGDRRCRARIAGFGQRMPAVRPGFQRRTDRGRGVRRRRRECARFISALARRRVLQIEPAVHDAPRRDRRRGPPAPRSRREWSAHADSFTVFGMSGRSSVSACGCLTV